MSTPTDAPTISAWSARERRTLRLASQATGRRRARSDLEPATVVLLYVLAKTGPVVFRPGEIAEHTGLNATAVAGAVGELEAAGLIEPGATISGRVGVLVPRALECLGLGDFGLRLNPVRPDVAPSGSFVEATEQELAQTFCLGGRGLHG